MTDTKYNGWTNWETWNFNLHFDGTFTEDAERACKDTDGNRNEAVDSLTSYISDMADEFLAEDMPKRGFLADVCSMAMREVNYREIAEHYIDDIIADYKGEDAA